MDSQFPLQNWMNDDEREAETKPRASPSVVAFLTSSGSFRALYHRLHEVGTKERLKRKSNKGAIFVGFFSAPRRRRPLDALWVPVTRRLPSFLRLPTPSPSTLISFLSVLLGETKGGAEEA